MDLEYFAIAILALLAAMSPGPDFVLVCQKSLMGSRKIGLYTALGITAGFSLHCFYAVVGFAAIIQESKLIYSLIRYLGALYLLYLGCKLLFSVKNPPYEIKQLEPLVKEQLSSPKAFYSGFLCNALNPQASLFALSFFSQFITIYTPRVKQITIVTEVIAMTLIWFLVLAMILTHASVQKKFFRIQKHVGVTMGIFLIGFAIKISFF
jgi:RhtB (resistance to homoserine/threonine) family protein